MLVKKYSLELGKQICGLSQLTNLHCQSQVKLLGPHFTKKSVLEHHSHQQKGCSTPILTEGAALHTLMGGQLSVTGSIPNINTQECPETVS